jgi:hypothetical protein
VALQSVTNHQMLGLLTQIAVLSLVGVTSLKRSDDLTLPFPPQAVAQAKEVGGWVGE